MKIRKGEWDVVAQLSFQIQSKQVHGAADKLLEQLIRTAPPERSEQWNVLSFAERSLEFLRPRRGLQREIVRWRVISGCATFGRAKSSHQYGVDQRHSVTTSCDRARWIFTTVNRRK